jgi:hypothetical protein
MGVDTPSAKGMTGHGHFRLTILVKVRDVADVGIEIDIQVQPRARGFLLDLPARLERIALGALTSLQGRL